MKPLKLSGIQSSNWVRYAGWFANTMRVNCSDSEVVRVTLKQPGHWVFTDLNGMVVALRPVLCSDLTSRKIEKGKKKNRLVNKEVLLEPIFGH